MLRYFQDAHDIAYGCFSASAPCSFTVSFDAEAALKAKRYEFLPSESGGTGRVKTLQYRNLT